jgi:cobalt/nickel transport system permease protein
MHLSDGILTPAACAVTYVAAAGAVGYSFKKLNQSLTDRTIPFTGMTAALVFAGQMVNFPLPGLRVSGHLLGGVLAAALLGPWGGCIAMTLVLFVQAALFADGGWMSLGANVLNMGVVGAWGGYAVYSVVRRALGGGFRGSVVGAVLASWVSVLAAAALFCVEFRWGHPGPEFSRLCALMISFHSLIGVGEALITGLIISTVAAQRPELLERATGASTVSVAGMGRLLTAGLVTALAVAAFLAPFASEHDDGLEAAIQQTGIEPPEGPEPVAPLPDYRFPLPAGGWDQAAVSLAGIVGTVTVFVLALALGFVPAFGAKPAVRNPHA